MNATLDWGNSRVKVGLFEGQELRRVEEVDVNRPDTVKILHDLLENAQPEKVIYSSSGQVSDEAQILLDSFNAIAFTHDTPVKHSTHYTTRNTLGLDRILVMEAAYHEFPKENVLVVDLGTCITYDVLTSEGIHKGGGISPGWKMRLVAMNRQTARLPEAKAEIPDLIGTSTHTALQSGAYHGMRNELIETIRQYEARYSPLKIIVTGGDAQSFDLQAKKDIFARPNYTLLGLNAIVQHYAQ